MSLEGKRLVIVGDAVCSKNHLLNVFIKNQPKEEEEFTLHDTYSVAIQVEGKNVLLTLCDTTGQERHPRIRPLSYARTDVILMCFSIGSPDSLRNVLEIWIPEVKRYCPDVPIILLGNKKELRNDPETIVKLSQKNQEPVKVEEGRAAAKEISSLVNNWFNLPCGFFCNLWCKKPNDSVPYFECSAKNNEGVREAFEAAARAALRVKST